MGASRRAAKKKAEPSPFSPIRAASGSAALSAAVPLGRAASSRVPLTSAGCSGVRNVARDQSGPRAPMLVTTATSRPRARNPRSSRRLPPRPVFELRRPRPEVAKHDPGALRPAAIPGGESAGLVPQRSRPVQVIPTIRPVSRRRSSDQPGHRRLAIHPGDPQRPGSGRDRPSGKSEARSDSATLVPCPPQWSASSRLIPAPPRGVGTCRIDLGHLKPATSGGPGPGRGDSPRTRPATRG